MTRYWTLACFAATLPLGAVDFATEVHPILSAKCMPCHSGSNPQAMLSFASRATAVKGGTSGPSFLPGNPAQSLLLKRINGEGGLAMMPPGGSPLKEADIEKLRRWIEEGANWPDTSAKPVSTWNPPLEPRRPAVPSSTASNPIDRFLNAYWEQRKIDPPKPVSDSQFARRVYYDIWGIPPTPDQLKYFDASNDLDKRPKLIRELLANSDLYTGHWISFWNDLLRNDIGVVYHGERKPITGWLQQSLKANKPYRTMVNELLNPTRKEDPEGFLVGVNWRGDINASQTPFMQASQNTAQIFLGINLKCASCHDSFINKYLLSQAYGLAAYFTDQDQLELVRCDMKTGKMVKANFLYPELASGKRIPSKLADRRKTAAEMFTHPRNGRTTRTIVNRYWQKLIGRGLVEPVDEMDNEPWNADLLDWLAADFDDHDQNLQYLIEQIMTSIAYQAPTAGPQTAEYVFRGPSPRRITAEQFADTASAVTGQWPTIVDGSEARYVRDWQLKSSPLTRSLGRPIRDQVYTTRQDQATTFQALELANGGTLGRMLRRGARNLLSQQAPPPPNLVDTKALRRGAFRFDIEIAGLEKLWLLAEDAGSYDQEKSVVGWTDIEFVDASGIAKPLHEVFPEFSASLMTVNKEKTQKGYPMELGSSRVLNLKGKGFTGIRGWFVVDDASLQSDIGTSVRFFLFGTEPDRDQLIRVVGNGPVSAPTLLAGKIPSEATRMLYQALLSRDPNPVELERASALASNGGQAITTAGLEDLLWSLLLHPEFQYLP